MSVTVFSTSPATLSPPRSPNTRPPSRSERLLRDTLRRDELALAVPAVPNRVKHNRRHSSPTKGEDYIDREQLDNVYLFRGSSLAHRSTSPRRLHRSPATGYGADADGDKHYSRPGSPSPSSRRDPHDQSQPSTLTLTPHEQVLRTRLERVLQASRGIARAETREHERESDRRTSPQGGSTTTSSGRSDDYDDAWLPQDHSSTNTVSSSPTFFHQHHLHDHHSARSKTDPAPLTPPSPTTTSRSRSRSHSNMHSPHPSHLQATCREHRKQHSQESDQPEEPLTPPPTPPLLEPRHNGDVPSSTHHSPSPRQPFNARTASAHCRQIEGYVSFAAVEGLGQPPADGDDVDPRPDGPGSAADEGKGRILGRIWRVLGGEATGR